MWGKPSDLERARWHAESKIQEFEIGQERAKRAWIERELLEAEQELDQREGDLREIIEGHR
jgi:hypothetical protein